MEEWVNVEHRRKNGKINALKLMFLMIPLLLLVLYYQSILKPIPKIVERISRITIDPAPVSFWNHVDYVDHFDHLDQFKGLKVYFETRFQEIKNETANAIANALQWVILKATGFGDRVTAVWNRVYPMISAQFDNLIHRTKLWISQIS